LQEGLIGVGGLGVFALLVEFVPLTEGDVRRFGGQGGHEKKEEQPTQRGGGRGGFGVGSALARLHLLESGQGGFEFGNEQGHFLGGVLGGVAVLVAGLEKFLELFVGGGVKGVGRQSFKSGFGDGGSGKVEAFAELFLKKTEDAGVKLFVIAAGGELGKIGKAFLNQAGDVALAAEAGVIGKVIPAPAPEESGDPHERQHGLEAKEPGLKNKGPGMGDFAPKERFDVDDVVALRLFGRRRIGGNNGGDGSRGAGFDLNGNGAVGQGAKGFLIRIEKSELERWDLFDRSVQRRDDLLEVLRAVDLQRVGGVEFGGGRIGFEIAPARLVGGKGDVVEPAGAGDANLEGDGVAGVESSWTGVKGGESEITDGPSETRDVRRGGRHCLDGYRDGGAVDADVLGAAFAENVRRADGDVEFPSGGAKGQGASFVGGQSDLKDVKEVGGAVNHDAGSQMDVRIDDLAGGEAVAIEDRLLHAIGSLGVTLDFSADDLAEIDIGGRDTDLDKGGAGAGHGGGAALTDDQTEGLGINSVPIDARRDGRNRVVAGSGGSDLESVNGRVDDLKVVDADFALGARALDGQAIDGGNGRFRGNIAARNGEAEGGGIADGDLVAVQGGFVRGSGGGNSAKGKEKGQRPRQKALANG